MKLATKLNNDIKRAKNKLIKKYKNNGNCENFGQGEVRKLRDKYFDNTYDWLYGYRSIQVCDVIKEFSDWCSYYNGGDY